MTPLQQLAADIAAHGNSHVFGITGSGATLTVLDELQRRGVEPVRTYFEGSAALMAGTVGRISGHAGVCYGIKGPGLANMVSGLAASWLEAFPLVALAEAYEPGSPPEKAHKRLDQDALIASVAKGARYLSADGPGFASLAAWAEAEVPGPVLLQLAGDKVARQPDVPATAAYPGASADEVLKAIEAAKRPVVIAGSAAARFGMIEHLQRLRVPVFSTAAAKGIVDEDSAWAGGVYTGVGLERTPEKHILPHADLVIGLGLRPMECLATRPFGCRSVNIDSVLPPGSDAFGFSAVAQPSAAALWEALESKSWGDDLVQESRARLREFMLERFLPGRAFDSIARTLGRNVRMVMDTGNFCTIGEHVWQTPAWNLCLLAGQSRYMGTSIPMGLGAAVHEPAVPVVAVAGDGGIAMYLAELRLAVERKLPLLVVLMSDGRYGSVVGRALKEGLTQAPMQFANPSWSAVMQSLSMPVWRATDEDSLSTALRAWRPADGPGYVEIAFDPDAYQEMCVGIR